MWAAWRLQGAVCSVDTITRLTASRLLPGMIAMLSHSHLSIFFCAAAKLCFAEVHRHLYVL